LFPEIEKNLIIHLPPINLDEEYNFTSLLFTPEHSNNQDIEIPVIQMKLELQKYQSNLQEIIEMSRMRGQVVDSLVEPRTKSKFDKSCATELEE
jgi:hypothetical protein